MSELGALKGLYELLSPCNLCPLECGSKRLQGEVGVCNAGVLMKISHAVLYKGEEPPLSGKFGSGTIFFSNCNLKCVYCQNYNFSQNGAGKIVSVKELSQKMLELERNGAANINFVNGDALCTAGNGFFIRCKESWAYNSIRVEYCWI
jgi:Uncharacterized Fe-S protein PflX, homolog of pyruvate formate lyase activating proteins